MHKESNKYLEKLNKSNLPTIEEIRKRDIKSIDYPVIWDGQLRWIESINFHDNNLVYLKGKITPILVNKLYEVPRRIKYVRNNNKKPVTIRDKIK